MYFTEDAEEEVGRERCEIHSVSLAIKETSVPMYRWRSGAKMWVCECDDNLYGDNYVTKMVQPEMGTTYC